VRPVLIGVGLLVVAAVTMTAVASNTSSGPINVTATLESKTNRQLGRAGRISNGSEQSWKITDRRGRPIGKMFLACRWITNTTRLCDGELDLPLGKIAVQGTSNTEFEGEWSVIGGTGQYRGGGGVMLYTAVGLRKHVLMISIIT
jgi:hypothetical protein